MLLLHKVSLAEFMAEIKKQEETSLPIKRKSDLHSQDNEDVTKKSQKCKTFDSNNSSADDEEGKPKECEAMPKANNPSQVPDENSCSLSEDNNQFQNDNHGDEDDEGLDGKSEVDRKGKGIVLGDKGKGKMIIEDEDDEDSDDDDESSDDWEVSNDDSDLSDDPLTEVDLENILPSRTRRKTFHPGVYVSNDLANVADEEDDDDSDDSEE